MYVGCRCESSFLEGNQKYEGSVRKSLSSSKDFVATANFCGGDRSVMFCELLAARGAHQELLHTSFHLLLIEPTLLKPSTYIAVPNFSVFYDYSIKLNCHTHNTAWLTSLDMFHQINVTLKRRCVIATSPVLTAGPFAGASSPFRHEASTIGIVNLRRIRPQRASILQESIGRILVIIRVTTKENTSEV